MTAASQPRGGAPVGFISELDPLEAGAVMYLRLWCSGPEYQSKVRDEFFSLLGPRLGHRALQSLDQLCDLCAREGRRPLMRHNVSCKCLGADESCFANFVAAAAQGENEDAIMIATLLVRPDLAPCLMALATQFGLALTRMSVGHSPISNSPAHSTTLH